MIIGIGNDMVDVKRIEKMISEKFIARCFTDKEQEKAHSRENGGGTAAVYAKHFAAKEAVSKALGSGIGADAGLKDIEVSNDARGKPVVTLSGAALKRLKDLTPPDAQAVIHLSLSDEGSFAQAFVVIEARVG